MLSSMASKRLSVRLRSSNRRLNRGLQFFSWLAPDRCLLSACSYTSWTANGLVLKFLLASQTSTLPCHCHFQSSWLAKNTNMLLPAAALCRDGSV